MCTTLPSGLEGVNGTRLLEPDSPNTHDAHPARRSGRHDIAPTRSGGPPQPVDGAVGPAALFQSRAGSPLLAAYMGGGDRPREKSAARDATDPLRPIDGERSDPPLTAASQTNLARTNASSASSIRFSSIGDRLSAASRHHRDTGGQAEPPWPDPAHDSRPSGSQGASRAPATRTGPRSHLACVGAPKLDRRQSGPQAGDLGADEVPVTNGLIQEA